MEKEGGSRIRSRKWKEVRRAEYEEGENMKVRTSTVVGKVGKKRKSEEW
jgi:hypothetical protein